MIIVSIIGILMLRFIGQNLERGQITFLLLFASICSIHEIFKGNTLKGASLLALGINIKLMPVVFILYLIYRAKFKAALWVLFFLAILFIAPLLIWGVEHSLFLHQTWWEAINPNKVKHAFENKDGLYNLSSFIPAYFSDLGSNMGIELPRNILSLNENQVLVMTHISRLILVLFTIYFLRTWPFKAPKGNYNILWELSYICLVIPLIFPRQSKYAYLFLLPAVFYLVYYLYFQIRQAQGISQNNIRVVLTTLILYFILANLTSINIIGRDLYNLSQYYKSITFGVFFLLMGLALSNPKNILQIPKH
ncbi:MAG: glycosyltransferase family 87 protein [Cyclobacteriaceae bacterium]